MANKHNIAHLRRLREKMDVQIDQLKGAKSTKTKAVLKNRLNLFTTTCTMFVCFFEEWKDTRQRNIDTLIKTPDYLEEKTHKTNIPRVAGSTASLVGGILTIAGLITMPLTLGATTPLLIAGLSIGIPGAMTGAGAEIANFAIDKTHWKKIAALINDDEEMTGELLDFSDKILSLATLLECKLKEEKLPDIVSSQNQEGDKIKDALLDAGLPGLSILHKLIGSTPTLGLLAKLVKASENLAAISLRKALNLVNPIPFWKAVDEAGGMAAANAKLLASTGAKAAYGLSWAAAGVFTIVDIRNTIYTPRHIHLYNNKQQNPQSGCSNDTNENVKFLEEADEGKDQKRTKGEMIGDAIKGYFTDTFLDKTICKPAEKMRHYAEFLRHQEALISENETIQLLLNNE